MAYRILHLLDSDQRRGAEVFGERLARGLAELGWDVEFVSLASDSTGPWVSADPVSMRDEHLVDLKLTPHDRLLFAYQGLRVISDLLREARAAAPE